MGVSGTHFRSLFRAIHNSYVEAMIHLVTLMHACVSWLSACDLQIAITGKSFCKASEIATELIINNILRIGRVNVIGDVILFLGKLCVSLSSALFAFLMLDTHKYRSAHNKISSPVFPVVVCYFFSLFFLQWLFSNQIFHNPLLSPK